MPKVEVLAPTLELSLEVDDGGVRGVYTFRNTTKQPLAVLDQMYRTDPAGNLIPDNDLVYVFFEEGTLIAARQLIRVPDDISVEWPEVPGLRRVFPRESESGSFVLRSPLQTGDPYTKRRQAIAADSIESVVLSIGYYVDSADVHVYRAKVGGGGVLEYPAYSDLMQRHNIVRSEPVAWPKLAGHRPRG